jgi:membrane protein DedA with SNARE-associated domain
MPLLLAVQRFGGMNDQLESAMFWVGALLAFLPVLVLGGVLLYVWRQKRRRAADEGAPAPPAGP